MNPERLTALCESHRMKSKLTLSERRADDISTAGWDTLLVYDGRARDFSRPAWISLREALMAEMHAQGYEPMFWYAISDDRQHGIGWVRQGAMAWDSDPRAWHPGFQLRLERLTKHLCVACGFDLRATPDRCPECDTIRAR